MELLELGFTDWFQKKSGEFQQPEYSLARIVAVDKEKYLIKNEIGEIPAEIIGKIRFEAESNLDFPTIGDWVYVQYFDNRSFAIIHGVFPRKSVLKRKTAGKKVAYQIVNGVNIKKDPVAQCTRVFFILLSVKTTSAASSSLSWRSHRN